MVYAHLAAAQTARTDRTATQVSLTNLERFACRRPWSGGAGL